MKHDLVKLKADTNEVLKEAKARKWNINEAINWADLRCTQAAQVVTNEGDEYLEVQIEEAAPDCEHFKVFIGARLLEKGWAGIQVVTEW